MSSIAVRDGIAKDAHCGASANISAGAGQIMVAQRITHRGDWCSYSIDKFCQEDNCNNCIIYRERASAPEKK